jgi:threonyl-tRNA synthetase
MNAKIRDAEKQKVPYMLVVGDREVDDHQVDIRRRSGERLGAMKVDAFKALAVKEVEEKVEG